MVKFILLFFFVFSISLYSAPNTSDQFELTIEEVGGSNYPFWSVGTYIGTWSEEEWRRPGNLKPVIGLLHEDPALVQNQLFEMYQQGQRKIALMIWFSVFDERYANQPVLYHMINANLGKLPPQQELNLRYLLKLIQQVGFNEVQVRFAQQWLSEPSAWSQDLQYYALNSSFIFSTRNIIEEELVQSKVRRVYDLGAELGGLYLHAHNTTYMQKLWSDYVLQFGPSDTVGFSFAMAPGRVAHQYSIYKSIGVFPSEIAIDVYGSYQEMQQHFYTAYMELVPFGVQGKPFIIQEVYYNDPESLSALKSVQNLTGMNIRTLMQWPLSRESVTFYKASHISEQFPFFYFNNLPIATPWLKYLKNP